MKKTIGIGRTISISIFLFCLLLVGMTVYPNPIPASAASSELAYQVTKGECYITGKGTETGSTLVIPATISGYRVKGIKEMAFYNGTFTSVAIENGVEEIGNSAFSNCSKLAKITLPDSIKKIGSDAFYNTAYVDSTTNWDKETLYIGKYLIETNATEMGETFEIKDGTTLLAEYSMFFSYHLKNLILPKSVKIINDSAFDDCNTLDKIYFKGSRAEWNIKVGGNNEIFSSAKRYYYSETQPNESGLFWHYVSGQVTEWPPHTHSYTSSITKAATCTEKGERTFTCICGKSYTEQIPALGHSFSVFVSSTSGNCTEAGTTVYKCSRCNQTRTTAGTPLGHNYSSTVHAATCTGKGYTEHVCSRCKDSYKDKETAPLGHAYTTEIVEATCTEGGYTVYKCMRCEDSYESDFVEAFGHEFKEQETQPTCTEAGGSYHICTVCGYEYQSDIILPSGHSYESEVIRTATCTEDGERHYHCTKCGNEYTKIIPAFGHTYEIIDEQKDEEKTLRTYICTTCGESYTEDLGNQYEKVTSYIEYLFNLYSPYMIWVFLGTSGGWSVAMGVAMIIARKNEEKEKAKRMLVNYGIGLIVIFSILVACPYLVRGIAALIT